MVEKAVANVKSTPSDKTDGQSRVVVIDIGKKQKKKAIRRLRQGRGKLMPKVESAIKSVKEETGAAVVIPLHYQPQGTEDEKHHNVINILPVSKGTDKHNNQDQWCQYCSRDEGYLGQAGGGGQGDKGPDDAGDKQHPYHGEG